MAQVHGAQELEDVFAQLFATPSIESMLTELSDKEFEHFVGYVFRHAGFGVEHTGTQYGLGLDLKLFNDPSSHEVASAGVSVKQLTPPGQVTGPHVTNLRGSLMLVRAGGVPGYIVTTSTLNGFATNALNNTPRIWPMDGAHFLRYITYTRGTRAEKLKDTESDPRLRRNLLAPIPPEVFLAADEVKFRSAATTRVLAVANHKGGVGKTTSALNIAFGLAAHDKQVLLVDMDPQSNLTSLLPTQTPHAVLGQIGDYFSGKRRLAELVRQTQFKRIWLLPSALKLTHSDEGIAAGPSAEVRFARDLHSPDTAPPASLDARPFDWIIIDTGPSMGLFTRAALAASHSVVMPLSPSVFADMGMELLVETVNTMRALTGHPLGIMGCLVTQWQENALNQQLLAKATLALNKANFGLFSTKIPLDKSHIEKAHLETGKGKTKGLFNQKWPAVKAYTSLVEEML